MTKRFLNSLLKLHPKFEGKKVAVVGDMMLDSYFIGNVKRISPEAPVPVIEVDKEIFRFGGAANVAYNLVSLGAKAFPIGLIGSDDNGAILSSLVQEASIDEKGLIIDSSRPTTAKTRVIAESQHIVRIDKESKTHIDKKTEKKIIAYFEELADDLDAVILQDYNKGVLTKTVIKKIIDIARKKNLIITVDPKFENFFEYKNATVFKPNKKETEDAFGIRIETEKNIFEAGSKLLRRLNAEHILLTLGAEGIALFGKEIDEQRIPTKARNVADVSGAGDTVISTLTVALCAGADIKQAAYLANLAGGIVCEEIGIVPIETEKLFNAIEKEF
ncbi:MAG: D-glycero-beta-D-manno-heptose-7-phosphate kinase [Chlorobi bacterium]|nr:D-glycero-beta-D-manno-heptose-7-phosphate kinase [Chlorobiota bacterium]